MDSMNYCVNGECCQILNNLLESMNCISPPIRSLLELRDGSTLAELIDNFEQAFDRSGKWFDNYSYIHQWLNVHAILIPNGKTVTDILKSEKLSDIVLVLYSILTIFAQNAHLLAKLISKFEFTVTDEQFVSMICFVKWQLCEEEISLKTLNLRRIKAEVSILNSDNINTRKTVVDIKNSLNNEEMRKIRNCKVIAELAADVVKRKKINIQVMSYSEC